MWLAKALRYALAEKIEKGRPVDLKAGENIRYVVPHRLNKDTLQKKKSVCKCAQSHPSKNGSW